MLLYVDFHHIAGAELGLERRGESLLYYLVDLDEMKNGSNGDDNSRSIMTRNLSSTASSTVATSSNKTEKRRVPLKHSRRFIPEIESVSDNVALCVRALAVQIKGGGGAICSAMGGKDSQSERKQTGRTEIRSEGNQGELSLLGQGGISIRRQLSEIQTLLAPIVCGNVINGRACVSSSSRAADSGGVATSALDRFIIFDNDCMEIVRRWSHVMDTIDLSDRQKTGGRWEYEVHSEAHQMKISKPNCRSILGNPSITDCLLYGKLPLSVLAWDIEEADGHGNEWLSSGNTASVGSSDGNSCNSDAPSLRLWGNDTNASNAFTTGSSDNRAFVDIHRTTTSVDVYDGKNDDQLCQHEQQMYEIRELLQETEHACTSNSLFNYGCKNAHSFSEAAPYITRHLHRRRIFLEAIYNQLWNLATTYIMYKTV